LPAAGLKLEATPGIWSPEREALWRRIELHDFEPETPLNFTRRLARDHGWRLEDARAAVAAYRRFCFLAVVSPTPMTPSEIVDEVWHQHLVYSRDYWDVWCGEALRADLHHDPTPGGPEAQALYRRQYAETLALYERFFGPSGADIWPATHLRFSSPRYRMTDLRFWFVAPRPVAWLRQKLRGDVG
jgi:hypothetical protein